jgi:hypothetical protein
MFRERDRVMRRVQTDIDAVRDLEDVARFELTDFSLLIAEKTCDEWFETAVGDGGLLNKVLARWAFDGHWCLEAVLCKKTITGDGNRKAWHIKCRWCWRAPQKGKTTCALGSKVRRARARRVLFVRPTG